MKTWNFGIVGAGLIADFHAKAIGPRSLRTNLAFALSMIMRIWSKAKK
ncbi:MAG: hypothetical protein ACYTFW_10375 [Planctomycetota bacterium]